MDIIFTAFNLLVILFSITLIVVVYRQHKEKVHQDLRRIASALHLRR